MCRVFSSTVQTMWQLAEKNVFMYLISFSILPFLSQITFNNFILAGPIWNFKIYTKTETSPFIVV